MTRARIAVISQVIERALKWRRDHLRRSRLAREAAKLDRAEEQARAEEEYAGEGERPGY
jgi:hypothetical protein